MYSVYILYSTSRQKFYAGQTNDVEDRLRRHNAGESLSTKSGVPWKVIYTIAFATRSEAVHLETKIKKRGIKRYFDDIGFDFEV